MMMKKFLNSVAAVFMMGMSFPVSAAPAAAEKTAPAPAKRTVWLTRFGEAQAVARKENKVILVNFTGSDWCPWCVRLHDEVFKKKPFLDYASKNLVLLMVDFPRRKPQSSEEKQANQAMAQKYGVRGFPTILLLDSNGSVIARTGYRSGGADAYVRHLQKLLKK